MSTLQLPPGLERLHHELVSDVTVKASGGDQVRTVPPDVTLRRLAPVAEGVGITRVAAIDGLDRIGIPAYTAVRPTARSLATSQGKGETPAAARLSATMEAIELWHSERHHLPWRTASLDVLRAEGERVVDVDEMVRCPCSEFTRARDLRWTRALEIGTAQSIWVPYEAVHCDWRVPAATGEHAFQNGTNGLAGGNTVVEAVVHGLCELIERDAIVALEEADAHRRAARRVIEGSIDAPGCRELLRRFAAAGIELVIWDLTGPLGIPAYSCTAVEVEAPWHQPLPQARGSGAHPNREVALRRALTEVAQARAAIIAGSRDDIFYGRYEDYFGATGRAAAAAERDVVPVRRFGNTPTCPAERPAADLELVVERLRNHGYDEICVVDLTHVRWQVPVVKVIVPGLRWRPWDE